MPKPFTFEPGSKINLDDLKTHVAKTKHDKESAKERLKKNAEEMADLARRLYAENKRALLLILQGMDTAGKDGTIRHVMRGVNPRSCQVVSFKVPSEIEMDHDFLWRVHQTVPRKGNIGIFNRSHYEDVLVVRVQNLVQEAIWRQRYEQINNFEQMLSETGTVILKCFLHISNETQRKRLQARVDDPDSRWKFNPGDIDQRKLWGDYMAAYEEALTRCNTTFAPWYVIPSDRKWYRNLIVSELLLKTLKNLDPQYPAPAEDISHIVVE
jgi:PPK2 family polyphosphate:nucleotide phosphotransferase